MSFSRACHDTTPERERFRLTIPYAYREGIEVPTALPLFPGGKLVQGRDGRAYTHVDPMATLRELEQDFKDYPMVLDENHAQETAAPNGEPSPALARMRAFALRADGSIWATHVEWTPYGLERIAQRAYVGVSPTVLFDSAKATEQDGVKTDGQILSIANAGLVNEPNFVMAALHSKGELKMTEEQIKKAIQDAIAAALAPLTALKEEVTAKLADMGVQVQAAVAGVRQVSVASHAKQVKKVLDRAVHAKKIAPASRDYHAKQLKTSEDLEAFEETFLKGASEDVVSNERAARGSHSKINGERAKHDKAARRLARDMGVDLDKLEDVDTDLDEDDDQDGDLD